MSNPPSKRRALGRGLSALLPGAAGPNVSPGSAGDTQAQAAAGPSAAVAQRREYFQAAIEEVYPNPEQPRRHFEEAELEDLAQSIRAHGVIQPVIVRMRPEGGGYFLIAGERRWRASQRAGLHRVPVVVQDVAPQEAFERALVENLQRSDLNPIEEAEAYRRLVDEYHYTQEQVAERVGKERSTVANSLRLLRLPLNVRRMLEDGKLAMGHARALLGLESPSEMESTARAVASRTLSVRATEDLVRKRARKPADDSSAVPAKKSASVRDLESRLTKSLGAQSRVAEDKKGKGGTIEIRYIDLDDLDRLLARLLS
jgi:ParB family chromosome partitioning protein